MTNGSPEESGESFCARAWALIAPVGADGFPGTWVCASEAAGTPNKHSKIARSRVIFSPRRRRAPGKCRLDATDGKARKGAELRGWQLGRLSGNANEKGTRT